MVYIEKIGNNQKIIWIFIMRKYLFMLWNESFSLLCKNLMVKYIRAGNFWHSSIKTEHTSRNKNVLNNPVIACSFYGEEGIFMRRNSMRSYWLSNDSWYTIKNRQFELTPSAPPEAKRSFVEWNKREKINIHNIMRILRAKFL